MKKSLKKLRGALRKQDRIDTKILPLAQLDELTKASQDMEDMRDCYDSLLSAAAAAANSAYEFSESLREMGACLLQKIELNDDEEAGKVLIMLGKAQFELQKLVDSYRAHISQTITIPSESLLNELHTVEGMKRQCDEKREIYDYMRTRQKDKGKSKSGKGETFSSQQLQVARDEFDEEATLFVFRLKSLKQGQSRSLLTQAARHHASQLSFFRKALKSLEAVDPHVKSVAEQQHIEYQFTGLEDEESDDYEDDEDNDDDDAESDSDGSSMDADGELSFDYRRNQRLHNLASVSRKSMEVDLDVRYPHFSRVDAAKENLDFSSDFIRDPRLVSQSAPLLIPKKLDTAARIRQLRPSSTKKFHSYVLPTPGGKKGSYPTATELPLPEKSISPAHSHSLWHSVPLDPNKPAETDNLSTPVGLNPLSVLKESNNTNTHPSSHSKKIKRLSFSGPLSSPNLTSRPWAARRTEPLLFSSGPILTPQRAQSLSPNASPALALSSSPRISELHELPRPPSHLTHQSASPSGLVGYSAPLMSRTSDKLSSASRVASPLPTPPGLGNSPRPPSSKMHGARQASTRREDNIASPPLTPISLSKVESR